MIAKKAAVLLMTLLTIGGCGGDFEWFPSGTRPKPFTVADKADIDLAAPVESDPVTINGNVRPAEVSIANGWYAIEGGAYTQAPGKVAAGQKITILQEAASTGNTPTVTTLTVGGVSATFTSRTRTPAVFSNSSTVTQPVFKSLLGVDPNSVVTSEPVTIAGNTIPSTIKVAGGTYSFDGSTFVSTDGVVSAGQQITLRHTAAATVKTPTKTTLTLRGVTATFYSFTNGGTTGFSNYSAVTPVTSNFNVSVISLTAAEKSRAGGNVTFDVSYSLKNTNGVSKSVILTITGLNADNKKVVPGYFTTSATTVLAGQTMNNTSQFTTTATAFDSVKTWVVRDISVQ